MLDEILWPRRNLLMPPFVITNSEHDCPWTVEFCTLINSIKKSIFDSRRLRLQDQDTREYDYLHTIFLPFFVSSSSSLSSLSSSAVSSTTSLCTPLSFGPNKSTRKVFLHVTATSIAVLHCSSSALGSRLLFINSLKIYHVLLLLPLDRPWFLLPPPFCCDMQQIPALVVGNLQICPGICENRKGFGVGNVVIGCEIGNAAIIGPTNRRLPRFRDEEENSCFTQIISVVDWNALREEMSESFNCCQSLRFLPPGAGVRDNGAQCCLLGRLSWGRIRGRSRRQ